MTATADHATTTPEGAAAERAAEEARREGEVDGPRPGRFADGRGGPTAPGRDGHQLVDAVARLVGVDLASRVTLDARPRAHGSAGLVHDGRVHLDDRWWRPDDTGRRVLVHEAVHLWQHELAKAGTVAVAPLAHVEAEAHDATDALLAGHHVDLRHGLAGSDVALHGGDRVPPDQATGLAAHRLTDEAVRADHEELVETVRRLVGQADVTDGGVDEAVATLDGQPLDAAAAAVHVLPRGKRTRLLRRLDARLARERRDGVLAVLVGVDEDQVGRLDASLFHRMDLDGLRPEQHRAAVAVLSQLRHAVLTELLDDDAPNHHAIGALVEDPLPTEPAADPTSVDAVVAAVRDEVRTTSRAASVRALQILAALSDERQAAASPTPDADGAAEASPPPGEGSAAEASEGEASEEGAAADEPGPRPLERAVAQLAEDGSVDRLVDGIGGDRSGLTRDEAAMLATVVALRDALPRRTVDDARVERLRELLSRSFLDWAITDRDAAQALPIVLEVARTDGSLLRRLDAQGYVDRLFDELPDDLLYRPDVRGQTMEIMAQRREDVLFRKAHDKLSRSFFDWVVTARDAYLAGRMVEAMSAGAQERFARLDGGDVYARLTDELTVSMQQAVDRHGLSSTTAARTREEARELLADPATWDADRVETLRSLVLLAITTGLGAWVFDRSRDYAAHTDEVLRRRVVQPFGLFDPAADRLAWEPGTLEGTGFFQEGVFEYAAIVPLLLSYVPIIAPLFDRLGVDWRTRTADDDAGRMRISLDAVQRDFGRMTAGAALGDADDTRAGPDLQGRAEHRARLDGTNELVIVDRAPEDGRPGVATITAPALELTGYRAIGPDGLIAFSGLAITGFELSLTYPAEGGGADTVLDADLGSLALDDLVYAAEGDVHAASRVVTDDAHVHAEARTERSGFVAWLWPMVGEILALTGLSDRPGTVDAQITVGEVVVTGLVAAGQRVERVRVTDLLAGQARDELGRLRLQLTALERRRERTEDPAARRQLDRQLSGLRHRLHRAEEQAGRRDALEDRFRADPSALDRGERNELRRLRGEGGYVLDAATVTVEGLSGTAEVDEPIHLSDVSGEARLPGVGRLGPSAAERARTFLDTGPSAAMRLRLHVGHAGVGATRVPGEVPDEAALTAALGELDEALQDAEDPVRARLFARRELLVRARDVDLPRFLALEERARQHRWGTGGRRIAATAAGGALTRDEERERGELRRSLRALTEIRLASASATDLDVSMGLGSTLTTVTAAALEAHQVERGAWSAGEVAGSDLLLRLHTTTAGTSGLTGLPDTLARLEVGDDEHTSGAIRLRDVRQHGVRLVEGVDLEGIVADVRPQDDGWLVERLSLTTLTVTGLRLVSGSSVVTTFPDDPALTAPADERTTTAEPSGGGQVVLGGVDLRARLVMDEAGELHHATIHSLAVETITATDPIRYLDGTRDLTLQAEAISGVTATELVVPLAEGTLPIPTSGDVTVAQLTQLQVAGQLTETLRGAFTMGGPPPSGSTLALSFREDGVDVTHLDLPTLHVDGLVFDDGTRRVEVGGPAVLEGVTAALGADLAHATDAVTGDPTVEASAIDVSRLDVRRITAPHVRYVEGHRELEAAGAYDEPLPTIEGLHVRNLRFGEDFAFLGAALRVDRAAVGIAGDVAEGVTGGFEAEVTELVLDLGPGFSTVEGSLGTSRVRGGIAASGTDLEAVAGIDLAGLSIGAFSWDEATRTLRFGGDGPDQGGIHVDTLGIGPLMLDHPRLTLDMGTTDPGAATLTGVRVAAEVAFGEAHGGGIDWEHFRAEVHEVHADGLAVEGLTIGLPGSELTITLPAGMVATAGPIDVVPTIPELLVVERRWTMAGSELTFQGRVQVAQGVIPHVVAQLGSRLTSSGRLELDGLDVGVLAAGDVDLRLDELRARGVDLAADLRAFGLGHLIHGPPTPARSAGINLQETLDAVHAALLPFEDVLAHADGHLRALLELPWFPDQQIDVRITDGEVDLHRLEDALSNTGDLLLDFELAPPGLILEIDVSDVAAPAGLGLGGAVGGAAGLFANVDLLRWDLSDGEVQRIEDHDLISLVRLLDVQVPALVNEQVEQNTAGAPSEDLTAWRLSGIDLALDIRNPNPINVTVPAFDATEDTRVTRLETVIPPDTLIGLTASGDIPGPAGHLALAVARIALGRTELSAVSDDGSTIDAGVDEVLVEGASGRLDFRGGTGGRGGEALPPTDLAAHVEALTARGISLRLGPPGSAPPPTRGGTGTGGTP